MVNGIIYASKRKYIFFTFKEAWVYWQWSREAFSQNHSFQIVPVNYIMEIASVYDIITFPFSVNSSN